jgi:hypothetical protein
MCIGKCDVYGHVLVGLTFSGRHHDIGRQQIKPVSCFVLFSLFRLNLQSRKAQTCRATRVSRGVEDAVDQKPPGLRKG